ncbi:MAG: citryl-CoA lyase [Candidatus Woesearchaeota archaeon]
MKWETKISKVSEKGAAVRGYDVAGLVGKITFTDMIFLLLKGDLPKKGEREVLDAIFVSAAEHGIQVPSITAARIVQSAGNAINTSIAAGILSIGDYHGGAVEQAARLFQENADNGVAELVKGMVSRKERIPGYGHKHYERDPRVAPLFALAEKHKLAGKHIKFAKEVDKELCKQTKKTLHLNIDGAIAAIISDLGFPWQSARAFFIIPRTAGIAAHVVEERMSGQWYRREDEENVYYAGPASRKP